MSKPNLPQHTSGRPADALAIKIGDRWQANAGGRILAVFPAKQDALIFADGYNAGLRAVRRA